MLWSCVPSHLELLSWLQTLFLFMFDHTELQLMWFIMVWQLFLVTKTKCTLAKAMIIVIHPPWTHPLQRRLNACDVAISAHDVAMSARDVAINIAFQWVLNKYCIPMSATMAMNFVANCSHLIQPIRVQRYMILSCDMSSNECLALTV